MRRFSPFLWRLTRPFTAPTTSTALTPRLTTSSARSALLFGSSCFIGCALVGIGMRNESTCAEEKSSFGEWKTSVMTNYESRIRNYSSPEKIFSVFASVSKNGHMCINSLSTMHLDALNITDMTVDDFVRALIPHEHGELGKKNADGTKKKKARASLPAAFKIADQDKDGLISFEELLSIPEQSFKVAFRMLDVNDDGQVDQNEFMKLISFLRVASPHAHQTRSTSSGVAQGWITHYFGENGAKPLTFDTFSNFLQQLKSDVLRLEFNLYDTQEAGYISQKDFGMLLISYAHSQNLQSFIRRTHALETTPIKLFSFEQFQNFNLLLEHLEEVQTAMNLYQLNGRAFRKQDLGHLSKILCGSNLNQQVIDTIMAIFDTNNDGTLDSDEFVTVLKRRKARGLSEPRDTGFMRKLENIMKCIKEG